MKNIKRAKKRTDRWVNSPRFVPDLPLRWPQSKPVFPDHVTYQRQEKIL